MTSSKSCTAIFVPAAPISLAAAVLPTSRSAGVGTPTTTFATMIASGTGTAASCAVTLVTDVSAASVPVSLAYQTTDPATNRPTGTANTPVDIPAGQAQTFVLAFTATGAFAPTDVPLNFACANAGPASVVPGLDTVLLSASPTAGPDIVALAATVNNDGIVNVPGATGTGAFAVATVNVGAGARIRVTLDTGNAVLPVRLTMCQTDPATGQCLSGIGPTLLTTINAHETPTFAIFATGQGTVPFDPATNRIFVRFTDNAFVTRGATSVAVRTQ
jgi:hypothetical protein